MIVSCSFDAIPTRKCLLNIGQAIGMTIGPVVRTPTRKARFDRA
jgi:hypothetical protein